MLVPFIIYFSIRLADNRTAIISIHETIKLYSKKQKEILIKNLSICTTFCVTYKTQENPISFVKMQKC